MTTGLEHAFAGASPRLNPTATPWRAAAIHGAITTLWVLLLARALFLTGVFAWSAGIVYVSYDSLLLVFVFAMTLDLAGRRAAPAPRRRPDRHGGRYHRRV